MADQTVRSDQIRDQSQIFLTTDSHTVASRGGGGASAPGPGPVVGARAKLDFLLIGSQWGIQDFDKGGGPPKNMLVGKSNDLLVTILYLHTHKHTHKIIAINTRLYVLFYSNTCWNPGLRGIMHLHKKRGKSKGPSGLAVFRGRGEG